MEEFEMTRKELKEIEKERVQYMAHEEPVAASEGDGTRTANAKKISKIIKARKKKEVLSLKIQERKERRVLFEQGRSRV